MSAVSASPVNIVDTAAPPWASRPFPSDSRSSTIAASPGRLVTTRRPVCLSYQRNAGMPSFVPCSSPAWLAGVVDGTRAHHERARCVPARSQPARVGTSPEAIACRSTG